MLVRAKKRKKEYEVIINEDKKEVDYGDKTKLKK